MENVYYAIFMLDPRTKRQTTMGIRTDDMGRAMIYTTEARANIVLKSFIGETNNIVLPVTIDKFVKSI